MSGDQGGIELDRSVDTIMVGIRHRAELGDIDSLAESIKRCGLLQPITITLDGTLLCGARRLAAIKKLGWSTVKVWVRSGISGKLAHLLAEQDENVLHKPLTQLENATLYREIRELIREDAARRKASTQFSSEYQPGSDGPEKFSGPSQALGDAREQAASMLPDAPSFMTMDKIAWLQNLAADDRQEPSIREQAQAALNQIEDGAAVHPLWMQLKHLAKDSAAARSAIAATLSAEALERAMAEKSEESNQRRKKTMSSRGNADDEVEQWSHRAFVNTWRAFDGWWLHFDVTVLAEKLSDEEVEEFSAVVKEAVRFEAQLRTAIEDRHLKEDSDAPARDRESELVIT